MADLLSNIKTADGASGTMGDYIARREVALAAKISCFDTCMKAVMNTIYVVGRCAILSVLFWNPQSRDEFDAVHSTAYNAHQPFADLLDTAMVVPTYVRGRTCWHQTATHAVFDAIEGL